MGSGASVASKTRCEVCSEQLLTIFSRKKCAKCPKIVCSKCLRSSDATKRGSQQKLCQKCFLLTMGNFTRKDLDPYTVKELRHFLVQRHISTEGCKEKNDLVELVLRTSCENPLNQDDSEHSRHVELLRGRFRDANSQEINELSSVSDQHGSSPHSTSEQSESVLPTASDPSLQQGEGTVGVSPPGVTSPRDGDQENSSEVRNVEVLEDVQDSRNHIPKDLQNANRKGLTLDDIKNESDLETMTVRQLKEVLVRNFVDYKGCCEKPELLDRVRRLWRQHINKPEGADVDRIPTNELCKICMDAVIDCILLECGHMVTCTKCGKRLPECPICRCYVSRVVHVFRS